jgi:phage baseplate assembly protein W
MAQQYIGITLPIQRGNTGYFAQTTSLFDQIKFNYRNLILTKKGERVMQPEFGCDIHKMVFENITEDMLETVRFTVVEATERWMPFLEVVNLEVKNLQDKEPHKVDITVTYRFRNNPNVTNTVTVSV